MHNINEKEISSILQNCPVLGGIYYDYDTDIRIKRQEASEERAVETAVNFLRMGLSPEQVAQGTSLPLEKILKFQKQTKNAGVMGGV